MKSLKLIKIVIFSLVVATAGGLNYEGCQRLREICRNDVDCDYGVLYQSCGRFMTTRWKNPKGDALPPMSLVKAWLFFPEALSVYRKKKSHPSRHDFYGNYKSGDTNMEDEHSSVRKYSNDVIQRVRRVLDILEEGNAENQREDYGSEDSPQNRNVGNSDNIDNILPQYRQTEAAQANVDSSRNVKDWNNGIDMRVAKSGENEAGYDMYHLMPRNDNVKDAKNSYPSSSLSFGYAESSPNDEPQPFVNTETMRSRETLYSRDFNTHNKDHLKSTAGSEADVLPGDLQTTSEKKPKTFVVDKKQAPLTERKSSVGEYNFKKEHFYPVELHDARDLEQSPSADPEKGTFIIRFAEKIKSDQLEAIANKVQKVLWGIDRSKQKIISKSSIDPHDTNKVLFHMQVPHSQYSSAYDPRLIADKINTDNSLREQLSSKTGLTVLHARSLHSNSYKLPKDKDWDEFAVITAIVGGSTLALILASLLICSIKRHNNSKLPIELHRKEALTDYEELCRTQMSLNSPSPGSVKALNADKQRHGLVNGQGKYTKKTWREEPLAYNMDISTGHVILAYMEEHLKDEDKLSKEWEALCNYRADRDETNAGSDGRNASKNRYSNVLPYDHTRVKLRETSNVFHSDYINASFITDSDPRSPSYIATQGPLDNTIADFWQMIWEQGVVVIVNLTRLSDMGLPQCQRYWPLEGSEVYNTYQVHLISEHIWCDDYIVRSFYLKHLLTQETRTITQFHFLTWPDLSVPENTKPLLEFRRKVNKCYRGQACPIVIHCNNGVGRTGTYILIDMVLKKMIKGTKEIDIAATLEYLRDQRPDMVKTKAQFEFSLAAVAEEVTAILSSLSN